MTRLLTSAELHLLDKRLPRYWERTALIEIVAGDKPCSPAHERWGRRLRRALGGKEIDADAADDFVRAAELLLEEVAIARLDRIAHYHARIGELLGEITTLQQGEPIDVPILPAPASAALVRDPFERDPFEVWAPRGDDGPITDPATVTRRVQARPGPMPHRVAEARRPDFERAMLRYDTEQGTESLTGQAPDMAK